MGKRERAIESVIERDRNIVIYTDSLSALQTLRGKTGLMDSSRIICHIYRLQELLQEMSPCLVWLPGHSGIGGNEIADQLAKKALGHQRVDVEVQLEKRESLAAVDRHILQQWQDRWNQTTSLYKMVTPTVSHTAHCVRSTGRCRRKEVAATRLRLNNCRLNYYLHRIKCHDTGLCDSCKVPETIEHYVLRCEASNLKSTLATTGQRLGINMDLPSILNSPTALEVLLENLDRKF